MKISQQYLSFPSSNNSSNIVINLSGRTSWINSRKLAFYTINGAFMNPAYDKLLEQSYKVLSKAEENRSSGNHLGNSSIQTYQNNSYIFKLYEDLIQAMSIAGVGFPREVAYLLEKGRNLGIFPSVEDYLTLKPNMGNSNSIHMPKDSKRTKALVRKLYIKKGFLEPNFVEKFMSAFNHFISKKK